MKNGGITEAPARAPVSFTLSPAKGSQMASIVSILGMLVGTTGLFLGFFFLATAPDTSFAIMG